MQSSASLVVILGTGGTIAGTSERPDDLVGYTSGVLAAEDLVAVLPALAGHAIETETLARLDSADMDHATWAALRERAAFHLARGEVAAVLVTHGTDTLEETAYFLHRTLPAPKPVVLTGAMRPATSASPDGPQNLLDAMTVARESGARGVLAVLAGRVHAGADLRKLHGWRVDAFGSGDAGPLAVVEDGRLRRFRDWPGAPLHGAAGSLGDPSGWPVVDIVTSHAGARSRTLEALVAAGAQGIVIAGSGNGGVHRELEEAARCAIAAGVPVRRASRCLLGGVVGAPPDAMPSAGMLTPPQARIELMLDLMAAGLA